MRPTFILASLLAVVPFISAAPSPAEPARRANPGFAPGFEYPNNHTYNYQGCHGVNALTRESPTKGGQSKLTVGACLSVCNDNYLDWGGVGNNKGLCGTGNGGTKFPKLLDTSCQTWTCPGNPDEYCGSNATLVLYGPSLAGAL